MHLPPSRSQVKLLTTTMQMLSLFANDDSYPVSSPPAYSEYIADASGWANIDFYSFFNIGCLVDVSYLDAAMIRITVPTVLIALAMAGTVVFRKRGDEQKEGLCMQFIIGFTFLLFVSTSNVVFSILNCRLFADGNFRLFADLDVVCYSDEHMNYAVAAFFYILVYPVGVPITLLITLRSLKDDLFEDDPEHPGTQRANVEPKFATTKHLSSMYNKYKVRPATHWRAHSNEPYLPTRRVHEASMRP